MAQRHQLVVYLGTDTGRTDVRMDLKGKIEGCCSVRQLHQCSFGGKDEDLIREEVHLEVIHKIHGIGLRIAQDIPHFLDPLIQTVVRIGFLVFPMGCKALFCNFIHAARPDLYFHPLAAWPHYGSMQGLVTISLRGRNPIAQAIGIRTVQIRHNGIYLPTFGFFLFIVRIDNDPDGKKIIHFLKRNGLLAHLVPDGMDGFRTPEYGSLDAFIGQDLLNWCYEIDDKLFALGFLFVQLLGNEFISIRVGEFHGQIFQFRLNGIQSQAVGEGCI